MKAIRPAIFLLCALVALVSLAVGNGRQSGAREGTYDFRIHLVSWNVAKITLTAAGNGAFVVNGTFQSEYVTKDMKTYVISGTLDKEGKMRAKMRLPGSDNEGTALDGEWTGDPATLVITKIIGREVYEEGKRQRDDSDPKTGGTYLANRFGFQFILSKTPNPDQYSVHGRSAEFMNTPVEVRGTYYLKRNGKKTNDFVAFGEIREKEDVLNVKVDGKFDDGIFKLHYVVDFVSAGRVLRDEWLECVYEGNPTVHPGKKPAVTPDRKDKDKDKDKPDPQPSRGSLEGTTTIDRASAKIGDTLKLNLSYTLKGREEDTVQETLELVGPGDVVAARLSKERAITSALPLKKGFDIKCDKAGTYTVRVRVKGELTDEWKDSVSFTIEKPKEPTTTAGTGTGAANGSYGLVKKVVPKSPAPENNTYQGYTMSASVSEGSLQINMTPNAGTFSGYNLSMTWSSPPSTLKPGQVVELTCTAGGTRSAKDTPGVTASSWFGFKGVQVLEQKFAYAGFAKNEILSDSDTGKYKIKVPENASGGEIVIEQGYTGSSYSGGFHRPCTYTYQWNAKPIEDTKKDPATEPAVKSTTMVQNTPDEEEKRQIRARLEPASITLYAGELSQIVDIGISGFRTNTSDRVTVTFPQGMDNQISLPGQIVTETGSGSLDPANMNRPEHVDGYFFRARLTAPYGEQTIDIIVRQKGAGEVRLKLNVKVIAKPVPPDPVNAWVGEWDAQGHPWKMLSLGRDHGILIGTFADGNGDIDGTVTGNLLKFTWAIGRRKGSGELTMSADGKTAAGHYSEDGDKERRKHTLTLVRKPGLR